MIDFRRLHLNSKTSGSENVSPIFSVSSSSSYQKSDAIESHLSKNSNNTADRVTGRDFAIACSRRRGLKVRMKDPNNEICESPKKSPSTFLGDDRSLPRKTVKFEKTAKVKRVRPRHQYSEEEKDRIWYNDDDYSKIKTSAIATVRMMIKGKKSGGFVETEDHTARGLECRLKELAIARKDFKAYARKLVLDEQEIQKAMGIQSSVRLRKVYLKASLISSLKAQDVGNKDTIAAKW